MPFSDADITFMTLALQLAAAGRFTTDPNPNVGAVLVKDGQIIGQGYHHQAGGPHAEVGALQQAADKAAGATCYVTLEPCSHYGRTPPCALALIKAGVARVVIAMLDPNPLVAGKGVKLLQDAAISVEYGLLEAQARALNPGFLSRMERQRPYLRLKLAASMDGRTALANGQSKWLTGEQARADVQLYRAQSSAILSTASTVLADDARLTVRQTAEQSISCRADGQLRQPLRVILDRQQQLTGSEPLFQLAGPILLCIAKGASPRPLAATMQAEVTQLGIAVSADGRFALAELLQLLAQQQVNSVWVEAGATLAGALLSAQLVDELILYQAPVLLGDAARPLAQLPILTDLQQARRWQFTGVQQLGADVRLTARLLTSS